MFESAYRYPIAVDFGDTSLTAVQLKEGRRGLAVRGLYHHELNGAGEDPNRAAEAVVSALRQVAGSRQFSGRSVVAHLPPDRIFSFPIRFQVGRDERLEDAIVRETQHYLPFPLENAVIDYPSILPVAAGADNAYRATIIAARMEDIHYTLDIVKRARLSLQAVDFSVSSLARLHDHLFGMNDNPVILCHVGRSRTLAAVIKKEGILGERMVPWGFLGLIRKIQDNMELKNDRYKAKILLKDYGLSEALGSGRQAVQETTAQEMICQILHQIISPYIEEFIDELHRIIAYTRSEEPDTTFEGIYLYGQAAGIRNLDAYVERRLSIPAKVVGPMEGFADSAGKALADVSEWDTFTLALGLGMRKVSWL